MSEAGATVIECANADEGMGASLACGVKATGNAAGWIIALADMPYIQPDSIAKIAAALAEGAPIAAPVYKGARGHPVGIASAFRRQLEALSGDAGARSVLRDNANVIELIEVDDPGVCRDIDTPADLSESSRLR